MEINLTSLLEILLVVLKLVVPQHKRGKDFHMMHSNKAHTVPENGKLIFQNWHSNNASDKHYNPESLISLVLGSYKSH